MKNKNSIINKILCSHLNWKKANPLLYGSFSRVLIVCKKCGKIKLIDDLKNFEVLDDFQI